MGTYKLSGTSYHNALEGKTPKPVSSRKVGGFGGEIVTYDLTRDEAQKFADVLAVKSCDFADEFGDTDHRVIALSNDAGKLLDGPVETTPRKPRVSKAPAKAPKRPVKAQKPPAGKECSVSGCTAAYAAKGFCSRHYNIARKTGDPLTPTATRNRAPKPKP